MSSRYKYLNLKISNYNFKPKKSSERPKRGSVSDPEKLELILKTMPSFCRDFFIGIDSKTSIKTQISYAYDIRVFFNYLIRTDTDKFPGYKITDFVMTDLDKVTSSNIEKFLYDLSAKHLRSLENNANAEAALARKLYALRSMYRYFSRKGAIKYNPAAIVDSPKIPEKPIIFLEPNEVAILLKFMEYYDTDLEEGQKKRYYIKNKFRDIAIITLFLGTGIRVSELIGINKDVIDYKECTLPVKRKGGDTQVIFFNQEVRNALLRYHENVREFIVAQKDHEKALFLSCQRKRMSVDAVEELVKKYAKLCFPSKTITPHKLRSSFATNMYEATDGDIAVVAELLNHKSIETTKRRYAKINRQRQCEAINNYKLTSDDKGV